MLKSELEYATKMLGREPNPVELVMLDVMYSEHCSYKSSRPYLKLLTSKGGTSERVVVGPGADAGVVSIGGGWGVAFKIESHNHPSAIEPYNGAATGVGGIVRDIMSMGAYPIALADSLHFGSLESAHSKWLLKNVVRGIADYGNCLGIPTVAGEVKFNKSFESNCLVNAACIGLMRLRDLPKEKPVAGLSIVLAGGSTGRDGIKGVSFASRNLTEKSDDDRSAVQIADPLTEKLLIDALEECKKQNLIYYVKDLGGGGLTCALTEALGKGGLGAIFNLDRVFIREKDMPPEEIMISESQERMLLFVETAKLPKLEQVLGKYLLTYAVIGETVAEPLLRVYKDAKSLFSTNPLAYVDLPTIKRKEARVSMVPDSGLRVAGSESSARNSQPIEHNSARAIAPEGRAFANGESIAQQRDSKTQNLKPKLLFDMLGSANFCSMEWVYRQYDHEVGARTVGKPGLDGALLQLGHAMLAAKTDSNPSLVAQAPHEGTKHLFAENWRNLIARGCLPIAYVDNLNFGSPEKESVMRDFAQSVRGMAEASAAFGVPCVGGNVSFYNEDETHDSSVSIAPNPVLMSVGIGDGFLPKPDKCRAGDGMYLVNGLELHSSVSEFLNPGKKYAVPKIDLALEKKVGEFMLANGPAFKLVHDNSKGLGISALELAIKANISPEVEADDLFAEGGYLVVAGGEGEKVLIAKCAKDNIPMERVGTIASNPRKISINGSEFERDEVLKRYNVLPKIMGYG